MDPTVTCTVFDMNWERNLQHRQVITQIKRHDLQDFSNAIRISWSWNVRNVILCEYKLIQRHD